MARAALYQESPVPLAYLVSENGQWDAVGRRYVTKTRFTKCLSINLLASIMTSMLLHLSFFTASKADTSPLDNYTIPASSHDQEGQVGAANPYLRPNNAPTNEQVYTLIQGLVVLMPLSDATENIELDDLPQEQEEELLPPPFSKDGPVLEGKLRRKIHRHILTLIFSMLLFCYLDRVNIGPI